MTGQISLHPLHGLPHIRVAHDVVTVEHEARAVTADIHRDPFNHVRAHEVTQGGALEVMQYQVQLTNGFTGGLPCLAEADYATARTMEDLRAIRTALLVCGGKDLPQFVTEREPATMPVLAQLRRR